MLMNSICKQIVGLLMRSATRTKKLSPISAYPEDNIALESPELQAKIANYMMVSEWDSELFVNAPIVCVPPPPPPRYNVRDKKVEAGKVVWS